eukprot:353794-Chlamydomonas_euryale.AAC.8
MVDGRSDGGHLKVLWDVFMELLRWLGWLQNVVHGHVGCLRLHSGSSARGVVLLRHGHIRRDSGRLHRRHFFLGVLEVGTCLVAVQRDCCCVVCICRLLGSGERPDPPALVASCIPDLSSVAAPRPTAHAAEAMLILACLRCVVGILLAGRLSRQRGGGLNGGLDGAARALLRRAILLLRCAGVLLCATVSAGTEKTGSVQSCVAAGTCIVGTTRDT